MKITINWLSQFLTLPEKWSIETLTQKLFDIGLEVEEVNDLNNTHKDFVIAQIVDTKPHPDASKLTCCKVDNGNGMIDVVCGAPNAIKGKKVVLAPIGSIIPTNQLKIKASKLRGEPSNGMLCSYSELDLGEDDGTIINLEENAPIGESFIKYHQLDDIMIEVAITPNRPDCLGVYGIARDLAASGFGELKQLEKTKLDGEFTSPIKAVIKQPELCKNFGLRYIKNIKNNKTPIWLKNLLNRIGQKSINAVVDITNYVNLSFARPLHAYDADKLVGDLEIDLAASNSHLAALNDENYKLDETMLVVKDQQHIQALAGVIGANHSAVSDNTNNLVIEAAYFSPLAVINSGRKLNINTDSRYRFERGIDIQSTAFGNDYATKLILQYCGGKISELVFEGDNDYEEKIIEVSVDYINLKLGLDLSADIIIEILHKLQFTVTIVNNNLTITIPSYRVDVDIKEDIIEEIARIYGYNNIPMQPISYEPINTEGEVINAQFKFTRLIKRKLATLGFDEVINYSFIDEKQVRKLGFENLIKLSNPISVELNSMRPSLTISLLNNIKYNEDKQQKNLMIFDSGKVYDGDEGKNMICGMMAGNYADNHYLSSRNFDFLDAKTYLFQLLNILNLAEKVSLDSKNLPRFYHPGRSAQIKLGKNIIGYFGELHPQISKEYAIKQNVMLFELFLDNLPLPKNKKSYRGPIHYQVHQPVVRKFSFIINNDVNYNQLYSTIKKTNKEYIKAVELFDMVEELKDIIEDNQKIYGFNVIISSANKNLNSEEIELLSQQIINNCQAIGAQLRI